MKLTFLGAAREVTGSCYLLEVNGKRCLIECGMAQGPDIYENQYVPVNPSTISAIFLTHAHIDHSGLLPMLFKNGYKGKVYTTKPTKALAQIMLEDSAHIQESEAEWRNRKAKRSGAGAYKPLYTAEDVVKMNAKGYKAVEYCQPIEVFKGLIATFYDAGHLLGSSSILLECTEGQTTKRIVFSGDIGNVNKPILRDPTLLTSADYVITESTYGDRDGEPSCDQVATLASIIQRTLDRGGNVIIPSFAIGRLQEMLYYLREIKERGLVKGHPHFPVYVDSPLAVKATRIFQRKYDCFDAETTEIINRGVNPIAFDDLICTESVEESKGINTDPIPKIILSASGMCEAGRIRHHLKYNLWRPESTVVFVGYQVEGTLGRILLDGIDSVNLFGEKIAVRSEIVKLPQTSSHADKSGLIRWIKSYQPKPIRVFVTHGEESVAVGYAKTLKEDYAIDAVAPMYNAVWNLSTNECIDEGKIKREKRKERVNSEEQYPKSGMYVRLEQAGKELIKVIEENRGGTNYDLKRFSEELEKLCKRWKREDK